MHQARYYQRVILNRVKDIVEVCLRKEQTAFWKHQSCTYLMNTLRINLAQSADWQTTLYLTFIDPEKAFDSINRRVMWKILSQYGIPQKILNPIKEMYERFRCKVLHEGKFSENFIIILV
jgi:hypothetical protein